MTTPKGSKSKAPRQTTEAKAVETHQVAPTAADAIEPKYPVFEDIAVPEKEIENWQTTADLLSQIANIPTALNEYQ